jgi:hypothetical protein
MEEKWTNTSFPPSSGVINPKPLASLNHFTKPFMLSPLSAVHCATLESYKLAKGCQATIDGAASQPVVQLGEEHGVVAVQPNDRDIVDRRLLACHGPPQAVAAGETDVG